jgi:protein O-GlcNAc transferase
MKHRKKTTNKSISTRKSELIALQHAERDLAAGKFTAAIANFASIPADSPNYGRACKGHGAALLRTFRLSEALPHLKNAHQALPEDPDILVDGADVVRLMGGLDVAEATYTAARQLGADGFQLRFGEASVMQERKRWLAAVGLWTDLNHSYAENPHVLHNLGRAWHELGETDLAFSLMLESYDLGNETSTLSTLGLLAPHAGSCGHDDVRRIRLELGQQLRREEGEPTDCANRLKNDRPLRIGYVSAFFHRPNWMKPVWALLNHHDRENFNLHLFADGPAEQIIAEGGYIPDEGDKIHDVRKLDNRQLAKLISDNEIDVLVDLNSYSVLNRLGLWSAKPAPVTIGWFNLYATSGLPGIEWLIGDDVVIKADEDEFYTEKIARLKQSYLTFQVKYDTPEIKTPKVNEPFTFGCLGSGYKITPEVRAAWIKILGETGGTRLLVRNKILGEQDHRLWFLDFFTREGIDPDRIILLGPAEHREFLETYGQIDLALDTFPYNGGTTTMESLWQGVPVICLSGDRWISRTSATLLKSAGLNEFIGKKPNDYVDLAVRWSETEHRKQLGALRNTMRQRLENSEVCDGPGLARDFERIVYEIVGAKSS